MNRTRPLESVRGFARLATLATAACLAASPAFAAEKTYQYYRFLPVRAWNGGGQIQLSEFTFSRGGTVLNTNNRNGSGVGVVPITSVTSGAQDPNANEGASKVADGNEGSKWFKDNPFPEAEALVFNFGSPVTIDAYNWRSANDSVEYWRNPVSWRFYGSTNGTTWIPLDNIVEYPINNANDTYQAGFAIPDEVAPIIKRYEVLNTAATGTAGIVLNGGSVTLDWATELADGVSIDPGAIPGPATGSTLVTPPANSTTTYTLNASRSGSASVTKVDTTVRAVAGGSATYRYVRFKARQLRNGGTIQISEFSFLNNGTPLTVQSVENPGGDSPGTEGVFNLIDGNTTNKWLDGRNQAVIFDFGDPSETLTPTFNSYSFVTGNDSLERDPIQWTLEGSNNGTTWSLIENVDFNYPTPLARNLSSRAIPLPGTSLKPLIELFTGDAVTQLQGQPFVLSWNTGGGASVSIDQGINTVAEDGSVTLTPPLGETTYTITVTSPGGLYTLTQSFTVNVIPAAPITTIAYDDFSTSGDELNLRGSAQRVNGRLRITPDIGGQIGEAWFRTRQPVAGGFEATFGMSLNQDQPDGFVTADGLAFIIQNTPQGSDAASVGENGVTSNALNIKFRSFGFNPGEASQLQVIAGTQVLATASIDNTPGTVLSGIPQVGDQGPHPYTIGTVAGVAPYRIRVVYVPGAQGSPGQLDVYFDDVAIVQNVEVDLAAIGAVDASGKAFVGFSARTGGNVQNSDVTDWHMRYGNFSALPPFGIVKGVRHLADDPANTDEEVRIPVFDVVWNAQPGVSYRVQTSPNMTTGSWTQFGDDYTPVEGQIGVRIPATEARQYYRVVEVP